VRLGYGSHTRCLDLETRVLRLIVLTFLREPGQRLEVAMSLALRIDQEPSHQALHVVEGRGFTVREMAIELDGDVEQEVDLDLTQRPRALALANQLSVEFTLTISVLSAGSDDFVNDVAEV